MPATSYQDLKMWQLAMKLATKVYTITQSLPPTERYGLSSQMQRSAVSIPSNMAEGQRRRNKAEKTQFCSIALGSVAELETQLMLTQSIYNLSVKEELVTCENVSKMINGFIRALNNEQSSRARKLAPRA